MSDFPGYPSPFSTWNLPTSARTVFPIGNFPVSGLVSGISSFLEPGYFPSVGPASLPDPLAPFLSGPYRPPPSVATRFLPSSLTELPALGIEPLYGCGLREPRGIAHSPNFLFSQNPSPLTFDQIYRPSGSNSVSPVSQYRNQLDQRYVNSRLLVPGRLSEPLARKPSSILNIKNKDDKPQQNKEDITKLNGNQTEVKTSDTKVIANQERSKKIWNPFETEIKTSQEKSEENKAQSKIESYSSVYHVKDSDHAAKPPVVEQEKENKFVKKSKCEVSDNVKTLPRQPIPHYPVKPIPLYESQRLALTSPTDPVDHIKDSIVPSSHNYLTADLSNSVPKTVYSQTYNNNNNNSVNVNGLTSSVNVTKSDKSVSNTITDINITSDIEKSEKVEKDLNQNLQVENNNNNQSKAGDTVVTKGGVEDNNKPQSIPTSETETKPSETNSAKCNITDVIVVSDTEEGNPVKPDITACVQIDENRNIESSAYQQFPCQGNDTGGFNNCEFVNNQANCYYQLQLQIEDTPVYNVPYGTSVESQSTESIEHITDNSVSSDFKLGYVAELNQSCEPFTEPPLRSEHLTSPVGSVEDSDSGSLKQHSPSKSSRSKALLSPKKNRDTVKKKELKDELTVLSHQVNEIRNRRNSVNKDSTPKIKSPSVEQSESQRELQSSSENKSVKPKQLVNRRKMAAGPGALTVMKHSEDSLSASISSSQISESDSDTQLSTDNAEKLFPESQCDNTHALYTDTPVNDQSSYLSPSVGNGNCDNQFFKTNNPQMCQSESDNQKPYLCVQEQNRFNEKSQILPPYNCYTPNQSTNVLPAEEESFQSHHDHEEITNFQQSNPEVLDQVDTNMDYDENSVMSESNTNVECDTQLGLPHVSDVVPNKPSLLDSIQNSFLATNDDEWEFLHSKQYIDNIYCQAGGCEPVKHEDGIRESDSPKTFIDLDTTTKEKQAQEKLKNVPFMKGVLGGKHYGKSNHHQGYPGGNRMGNNMYAGNQYDNYGGMGSHRWNNYNRNGGDGSMGQPKLSGERDGNQYDQNQYRQGYQPNYYPLNHGQNGGDKMYNQSGYHGNEYSQNDSNNYYQGQQVKGYQGNYGNEGRYDSNYYGNKPNDYNSQGNMYPPTSTEMPGSRYGNQNYGGNQGGYGQHYPQQSPSHSGSNSMVQYQNTPNPNFSLPRNATPGSSEFPEVVVPVKKKRGRKRKADKEPHDDSKPKPNTIVTATTNIGPLIDVDHPDCPIETYDYNNQIETIFNYTTDEDLSPIARQYLDMEQRLCKKMVPIKYGHPVNVIYCPLTYAFQTHRDFLSKFLTSERPILFLGMNPGPYGMSQNGCPFGETNVVRDWLKITGDVYKPEIEHPKKPVTGLACTRNEVSGARFWGLFQKICRVPENFFKHCYVHNFCPFAYMSESGKNITPPQLDHSELDQIIEACDAGLVELVKMLNVRAIIAVGKFVQQRASKALHNAGIMNIKVECILHPSPINPHANKGWEQIVAKQLIEMNVMQYLNPDVEDVQRHIDEWEKNQQNSANAKLVEPETL